jgi:glycerol-3-phosphate acyltransferase PlsY
VASVFSLIYALVYVLIRQDDWIFLVVTFVIVSLIIFKHRSNYIRLRNHQENRVRLFDWFDRLLEKRKKASDNKDI